MDALESKKEYRALLTETLPYEIPVFLDNSAFFQNMCDDELRNIFEKQFISPNKWTIPFNYSVRQYGGEKSRLLSLIHPLSQLKIASFYRKEESNILKVCGKSALSLRHVANVREFELNDSKKESTIEKCGSYFEYKDFEYFYKFFDNEKFFDLEKRFKYCLKLDVAKCFYHIYTHSIAWAVDGKETAKNNLYDKNRFGNEIDELMQKCNYNETNGIVVGSEFSRIFAEIIFQQIDLNVIDKITAKCPGKEFGTDYQIYRYVDDHLIFANDEQILDGILEVYKDKLEEYKLYINEKKTKKVCRPFISKQTVARYEVQQMLYSILSDIDSRIENDVNEFELSSKFNDFAKQFGIIASKNEVPYSEYSHYFLSCIQKELKRFCVKERANFGFSLLKYVTKIAFYSFALDMNVSSSVKLSAIITTILDFADEFYKMNCVYISDLKTCIHLEMSDILEIFVSSKKGYETDVEILNVLLTLSKRVKYVPNEKDVKKLWGSDDDELSLNYFQICTILFLADNFPKCDQIKQQVKDCVIKRFKECKNPLQYSEFTYLYFDLLVCPFLEREFKLDLIEIVTGNRSSAGNKLNEICKAKRWFFDWYKDQNMLTLLDKIIMENVY